MKIALSIVAGTLVLWVAFALILAHNESGADPNGPSGNPQIDALSETERNCLGMYLKYGDVPASKLTMGQIQQIEDCQARGLYQI